MLRLAVPNDGALHEPTLLFLQSCGLGILRTNLRRYTAEMPALPGLVVHFQRAADIGSQVEDGSADVGILGHDRYAETRRENGDSGVIIDGLGFAYSELVIGVPDSWIDVTSVADIADLSVEFREQGRDLQVATKYPRLVEQFLLNKGVNYFSLVAASGTVEAAPAVGYADIIADISSTGATMRENRLKTVPDGTITTSEACLIANRSMVANDEKKLRLATALVERIEAHLGAQEFYSVTANMRGEAPEEVASFVLEHADISGLRGPTISKVYTRDGDGWYAVTVVVEKEKLLEAVDQLRRTGGSSVTVSQPNYVFHSDSKAVARLTESD